MMDDTQYFNLGQAPSGEVHAAKELWGPALCETPLLVVDDTRRYTSDELRSLGVCPGCRGVAFVNGAEAREELHRRVG